MQFTCIAKCWNYRFDYCQQNLLFWVMMPIKRTYLYTCLLKLKIYSSGTLKFLPTRPLSVSLKPVTAEVAWFSLDLIRRIVFDLTEMVTRGLCIERPHTYNYLILNTWTTARRMNGQLYEVTVNIYCIYNNEQHLKSLLQVLLSILWGDNTKFCRLRSLFLKKNLHNNLNCISPKRRWSK